MEIQKLILLIAVFILFVTLISVLHVYLKKAYRKQLTYDNWHSDQQRKRAENVSNFLNK
jgi:hypothetical protein